MVNGFIRVAAAVTSVSVANPEKNASSIIRQAHDLCGRGASVIVFPEMCIPGYTCGDLFHNSLLLQESEGALRKIVEASRSIPALLVVGAPVVNGNALYNCGIAVSNGKIAAAVPKTYLPNYNEFYEKRWWRPADVTAETYCISVAGQEVPFGVRQLIDYDGVRLGIEICEDLWTPVPASTDSVLQGADVILNLSASDALAGKYNYICNLVTQQSARCLCGYVYASAGYGESSTDLVFDGIAMVAECGTMLSRNKRWQSEPTYAMADIDIEAIRRDRMHIGSFSDCVANVCKDRSFHVSIAPFIEKETCADDTLMRKVTSLPFVPQGESDRDERCSEIVNIQVSGLAKRLDATGCKKLVVGISGGLDSTLALLVAVKTYRRLGLDLRGIIGVTMPGFGTSGRTHENAVSLMETLGVSSREISIVPAVEQHFRDIRHDASVHDVTYENAQARQRTYILMDIANQEGGMVLGTGDLSELALGWATYNGDHMSMYGINSGVPKTLVRHLVEWFARTYSAIHDILADIIDTPISPELIPVCEDGSISQKTEDLVGPYELHDFFLYYTLRYGFSPARIYFLARHAFSAEEYPDGIIKKWLKTFCRRFFSQQFKRSCMPDGPKVGSVCLSPRGDWRMPSDASSAAWLADAEKL